MALVETEALVLRTYNLGEADKIVVCLSRRTGLVRGVASGCRRLKSRFGAALEPFTVINLSYYQKEHQELVSFRQVEIVRSSFDVLAEPVTLSGLAYIGDLILEFSPPYQENETLYRMVRACIETALDAPEDLPSVLRYFEVWLLRLEGFLPNIKRCADCGRAFAGDEVVFAGRDQALRCLSCGGGSHALSKELYGQMVATLKFAPGTYAVAARAVSERTKREFAQWTQQMITRVLERELKARPSYAPLKTSASP